MANDPDALFPSGPTTRRGLLSAFSRRAAEALPVPDGLTPRPTEPPEPTSSTRSRRTGSSRSLAVRSSSPRSRRPSTRPACTSGGSGRAASSCRSSGENILFDPYLSDSLTEHGDGTGTPHERITGLVVDPALLSFVDVVTSSHAHLDHLDPGTLPEVLAGGAAFVCAAGSEDVAAERAGRAAGCGARGRRVRDLRRLLDRGRPGLPRRCPRSGRATSPATAPTPSTTPATAAGCRGWPRPWRRTASTSRSCRSTGSTGTWTAADAARLAYEAGAQIAIPCHYEMFRHDTASTSRFVAECVRIGQEYRLPRAGERITIDYGV